jgi:hypothetical protein
MRFFSQFTLLYFQIRFLSKKNTPPSNPTVLSQWRHACRCDVVNLHARDELLVIARGSSGEQRYSFRFVLGLS